jgi:hypothetical protein
MGLNTVRLPDIIIANAFSQIILFADTAFTGVITVQVAPFGAGTTLPVVGDLRTLQIVPGTDVALAAGKAIIVNIGAFGAFSVFSSIAEGAQRTIKVMAQENVDFQA